MGLLDLGKGAVNPEKPLSLEHWLDSLGFASALYGMYETVEGIRVITQADIRGAGPAQESLLSGRFISQ